MTFKPLTPEGRIKSINNLTYDQLDELLETGYDGEYTDSQMDDCTKEEIILMYTRHKELESV